MDSGYKKITDINFGEYDATNYRDSSSRDLFNRIFYRDNRVDQILENNKYFVLGDKGTGKTAYSVYLSNNIVDDTYASIVYMGETEYGKFVRLKEQRDLILSDYTDVWRVILLLLMSDKIYKTEDRSIFTADIPNPIAAACFHLIFFEQSFNNPPIGKNKSIFNRFSSRSIKSCSKITLLHDQNGSNSYILFPGVRVNTVDAKTILKKIYNATPAKN